MTAGKEQNKKPNRLYGLSNLETPTDKTFTITQIFKSNDTIISPLVTIVSSELNHQHINFVNPTVYCITELAD